MEPCSSSALKNGNRPISTFVFLDFESTHLLDRKCRITEMCLLAVNREDMKGAESFPRVINKLVLCFDPQQPISITSSTITGLFNDSLENQKALTEKTITLINAFIDHLSKPVCLIAHNGNNFDFPLLVAELKRINQSLDNSLLCADSLEAFRSLDGLPAKYTPSSNQNSAKKIQNSPNNCDNTPVKSVNPNTSSPLKRRGTNNLNTPDDQSVKVSRLEYNNKEKVKKKLSFELNQELNSDADSSDKSKEVTEQKEEQHEEFSSSLNDTEYLLALESVEKCVGQDTLLFNNRSSMNECLPESSNKKEEIEHEDIERTKSSPDVSTVQKTLAGQCCVTNSTGYYVRMCSTEEEKNSVNGDEDTSVKLDETRANTATSSFENKEKLNTNASSNTLNLKNHLKETKSASNTKVQKSSTETNFVVTLRPHQYSPSPTKNSLSGSKNGLSESKSESSSSKAADMERSSNTKLDTQERKQNETPYVQRQSYKLEEIYLRKFGSRPPQSHRAEDDCITLLKIAKRSPDFIEWVDKNSILFSSIDLPF